MASFLCMTWRTVYFRAPCSYPWEALGHCLHNCWRLCAMVATLHWQDLSKTCIQFHSWSDDFSCNVYDCLLGFSSPAVTWEAPLGCDALRPPPVGGHAFIKFDRHRAVYFSGRRTSGRTNDVYLFDLDARVSSLYIVLLLVSFRNHQPNHALHWQKCLEQ